MDIEKWPSLVLRLLARVLQQGANFLERQGQKIKHLAEQTAGDQTSSTEEGTSTGDDDHSVPADENPQAARSPGQPPDHWLEKIEASEGPVQWIDHTGEKAPGYAPQVPSRSLSPSAHRPSSSDRENRTDLHFSPSPSTTGEARSTRGDERTHTDDTTRRTVSPSDEEPTHIASSPRSGKPIDAADREKSGRSRQYGAEEAGGEHTSGPASSASDPEASYSRAKPSPSQPMRLQPSSSQNRPAQERRTTGENNEPVEQTSKRSERIAPEAFQNAVRSASSHSTETAVESFDTSDVEQQPPSFPSDSREESSGSEHKPSDSSRSSAARTIDRPTPSDKRPAFSGQRVSPSTAFFPHRGTKRSERFPDSSAVSEVDYRSDPDTSLPKRTEEIPLARPSRFRWPDLPDVEQIIQEEISESRRGERHVRNWERRRRLDREQRGQLWSE